MTKSFGDGLIIEGLAIQSGESAPGWTLHYLHILFNWTGDIERNFENRQWNLRRSKLLFTFDADIWSGL